MFIFIEIHVLVDVYFIINDSHDSPQEQIYSKIIG